MAGEDRAICLSGRAVRTHHLSLRDLFSNLSATRQVERMQFAESFVIGDVDRPAVGIRDRSINGRVCIREPLRTGIVEVGQGAFLEFLRRRVVTRHQALGIAGDRLVHPLDPLGRNGASRSSRKPRMRWVLSRTQPSSLFKNRITKLFRLIFPSPVAVVVPPSFWLLAKSVYSHRT